MINFLIKPTRRLFQRGCFEKTCFDHQNQRQFQFYSTTHQSQPWKCCIVGSGPSGFYTAKYLMNQFPQNIQISMIERLPTPYGLVRYGVAPDHPEVKLVINDFQKVAQNSNFSFFGNVNFGEDVSIERLREIFDFVILSYGSAESDRKLGIKGEDHILGVESAREFVNWYNGLPDFQLFRNNLKGEHTNENEKKNWYEIATERYIDLLKSSESAVVIGQGNVALDVARMLSKTAHDLKEYDATDYALEVLEKHNKLKSIKCVGRRGPVQAACTTKELRELTKISNIQFCIDPKYINLDEISKKQLSYVGRKKQRLFDVMKKSSTNPKNSNKERILELDFYLNPVEFIEDSNNKLKGIKFEKTRLEFAIENDFESVKSIGTGEYETIDCQIAFRSIGYKSSKVNGVPYDERKCIVPNSHGKVKKNTDSKSEFIEGLYVGGWLKRGANGVILSNIIDSQETVESIVNDVQHNKIQHKDSRGYKDLESELKSKNIDLVSFTDYLNLDKHEVEVGKQKGKTREKIVSIAQIIDICKKEQIKN